MHLEGQIASNEGMADPHCRNTQRKRDAGWHARDDVTYLRSTNRKGIPLQSPKGAAAASTWNAFEGAESSKPSAAANGEDSSWANFESAPAAAAASSHPAAVPPPPPPPRGVTLKKP